MKNVLILTCSTGEGHNSAAFAVESALKKYDIHCEIKNPISFKSDRMEQLTSDMYNNMIRRNPALFGAVYKLGDFYASTKLPSPVYWANSKYAGELKQYILEKQFDAVVCTHLYGMEAMTAIRKDADFQVPCFGVLTDYVCIPFTEETRLTKFFVPSEETRQDLISHGIAPNTIQITGIPVDDRFVNHPDKAAARRALNIPAEKHVFLVMTGGVGCENMEQLCGKLHSRLQDDDLMIVFTGRNDELKNRLDAQYALDEKLLTVPFTKRVAEYMSAGDVLLTKSGGLSSAEAAAVNIPLVHIHAIPGCETYNARFFSQRGMSCWAEDDEAAVNFAYELAYDAQKAQTMCEMQKRYVNAHAAQQIAEEVIQYV